MKNLKTQGFILIDVDVVALNNAGKNSQSHFDNAVSTKQIYKGGKSYVYVSGQAWRYWWRDTLQKTLGWQLSPVIREDKIAFTSANPLDYADDDVFGYMKAAKEKVTDDKGKEKKVDITVTRVSPLKNTAIVSVGSVRPVENWSSMARQDGDSVPYGKQEYSAVMKGMFSIDLEQIGTFANYNKTGFKNLSEVLQKQALASGATELDDFYQLDSKGEPRKLIRLAPEVREKRVIDTIQALKYISGGAMQTNNMADVTPKFIVLATTNTGNHPFSHIAGASGGRENDVVSLNIAAIEEVLNDYRDNFSGMIFVGIRAGFMDEEVPRLKELSEKYKNIVFTTVNEAIDGYCKQVKKQMEE